MIDIETMLRERAPALRRKAALLICAAAASAMLATPGHASVTASLISTQLSNSQFSIPVADPGAAVDVSYAVGGIGFTFVSDARLTNEIYFKNGVINSSFFASTSVTTGVAVTFYNDHDFSYQPVLHSTLLAAGMGIGIVDLLLPGSGDTTTCTHAQLKNCGSFDDPLPGYNWNGTALRATEAGFNFDVTLASSNASLFHLSSKIAYDNGGNFIADIDGAASVLNNFTASINSEFSHAYSWDDTGVDIATGVTLNPGEYLTVNFTTTSFANAISGSGLDINSIFVQPMLYASFGDPTGGKGSTGSNLGSRGLFGLLSGDTVLDGIDTNSYGTYALPTEIVDEATGTVTASLLGKTTFVPKSAYPYGRPTGAVPEPTTWAMMIGGLALAGGLLRRRANAPALQGNQSPA